MGLGGGACEKNGYQGGPSQKYKGKKGGQEKWHNVFILKKNYKVITNFPSANL